MNRLTPEERQHVREELANLTDQEKRLAAAFLAAVRGKNGLVVEMVSRMQIDEYKVALCAARTIYKQAFYRAAVDPQQDQHPPTV